MALSLSELHPDFGAEVENVDLGLSLKDSQRDSIAAALEQYGILLFRKQLLTEDQQIALAKRFGTLDIGLKKASGSPTRLRYEELLDMSNVGMDNAVTPRDHPKIVGNIANQLWHSDSSFQKPATSYSMLLAIVIPPSVGCTEFADCRVAYETLSADEQQELRGLVVRHNALYSRITLGDEKYTAEQRETFPSVEWPIIRLQKSTGRNALFIGAHAFEVMGMTVAEGRMLLMNLLEHATRPDKIYRHEWRANDLIMWDNRVVLHRGRRWNLAERRELRRVSVLEKLGEEDE